MRLALIAVALACLLAGLLYVLCRRSCAWRRCVASVLFAGKGSRLDLRAKASERDCGVGGARVDAGPPGTGLGSDEAFAAKVIETTPEAILVVGADGRILRANAHASEIFGYSEDEFSGMSVETLMPERYRQGHTTLRAGFANEPAPRMMGNNRDLRGLRKNGSELPVEIGLGPMPTGEGQYVVVSIADVSERTRVQQAMLHRNARLSELLTVRTTELQSKNRALQARTEELSAALRRLSEGERRKVEQERRRLSQELHDDIGQMLAALCLNLEMARRKCNAEDVRVPVNNALQIADSIMQGVRDIVHQLRPPQLDDLGLVSALRWHLERVRQTSFLVTGLSEDLGTARLPPEIELACFRIVQESVTNVLRHASATRVDVEVRLAPERISLSIADDGVGFDAHASLRTLARSDRLGLLGMQERVCGLGGSFEVVSAPGKGCRISADIPIGSRPQESRSDGARANR